MINIRVFYHKKGRAKYISHLDTNRCIQRALKRSKLPVWYTEGFNPHIYLTFALPLSLGFESEYEVMDFRLTQEMDLHEVQDILNAYLPEGFSVFAVKEPICKPAKITQCVFAIHLFSADLDVLYERMQSFFNQESILVQKKAKKGFKTVDLKQEIFTYALKKHNSTVQLDITLPAGTQKNINPNLYIKAFEEGYPDLERVAITKLQVIGENQELFV